MGIIILPSLLTAFIIGIICLIKTIRQLRGGDIDVKAILLALLTATSLFCLICLSYILEGRAYALSPAFRLPMFMIIVPYIIHKGMEKSQHPTQRALSKILLMSIVISLINNH